MCCGFLWEKKSAVFFLLGILYWLRYPDNIMVLKWNIFSLRIRIFFRFVHSQLFSSHLLLCLVFLFLSETESHQREIRWRHSGRWNAFFDNQKNLKRQKQLTNLGMQLRTIQRRWPWKIHIQRYDWLVGWVYDMSICVGLFNVEFHMEHSVGIELPI